MIVCITPNQGTLNACKSPLYEYGALYNQPSIPYLDLFLKCLDVKT